MDLISVVDQISLASASFISLQEKNCLHRIDRLNTCDKCVQACPVEAISLGGEPSLEGKKCLECGLCLRLCPVGVFRGEDGVEGLFRCVQALGKINSLELCCNRHCASEFGSSYFKAALKTDRCLGSLGPSVFLSLFLMGIYKISLRLEECGACPLSKACRSIHETVNAVNAFFCSALEWPEAVVEQVEGIQPAEWSQRPVIDVKRPPMSRKSFLTNFLAPQSLSGIGRYVNETATPDVLVPQPGREQQRLAKVLNLYAELVPAERHSCLGQFLPVSELRVAESCDACGVCATMCRTGALDFVEDKYHHFTLYFSPTKCIGCGVCRDYCEAGAISLYQGLQEGLVDSPSLLLEPRLVISGELLRCERCHASFRKRSRSSLLITSELCPLCELRRSNPFGFSLPRNSALYQRSR